LLSTATLVEVLFLLVATVLSVLYALKRRTARLVTSPEQLQAKFDALLQLKETVLKAVPGLMLIIFGAVFVLDLRERHDPDWWHGLVFVVTGWVFVHLFTRRS
jgi:hypothetical protein